MPNLFRHDARIAKPTSKTGQPDVSKANRTYMPNQYKHLYYR